jgi:hypothetical protein
MQEHLTVSYGYTLEREAKEKENMFQNHYKPVLTYGSET